MRPPFFAFYPADFANDINVEAMSTLQVGAYMLLLCKAWQSDPPASLPNSDQILARLARVDAATWAEIKAGVLVPFHVGGDGRLHSKRLRREYDRTLATMAAKRKGGRKGAEVTNARRTGRTGKPSSIPAGSAGGIPAGSVGLQTGEIGDTDSSFGRERAPPPPAADEPGRAPSVADVVAHWNAQQGLTPCVESDVNRDRFIRSWGLTNPLWVEHWRAAIAFMGTTPSFCGTGPRRWRANLAWLFKDSNFANVVEQMLAAQPAVPADPREQSRAHYRAMVRNGAMLPDEAEALFGGPLDA
jgi:uncharacterized protein YdaU (DUF1376 family)